MIWNDGSEWVSKSVIEFTCDSTIHTDDDVGYMDEEVFMMMMMIMMMYGERSDQDNKVETVF